MASTKSTPRIKKGILATLTDWLRGDSPQTPAATLYQLAVAMARRPYLYQPQETGGAGVADTLDGRFDATTLMVVLVVWRLQRAGSDGKHLAQDLVDRMFVDMEASLLALGVGENVIGKRMRVLASAFGGRLRVYSQAVAANNEAQLAQALTRNLYRQDSDNPSQQSLAKQILVLAEAMRGIPDSEWLAGKPSFATLAKAARIRYTQFQL